jgi:retron-type reverse transcriptase
LTGLSETTSDISRFCINGSGTEATVPSRFVGWRSKSRGRRRSARWGIPTVVDRVCQQALRQVLEPIFEPTFSEVSFGFRPERSAHMAMRRIWGQQLAGGPMVLR